MKLVEPSAPPHEAAAITTTSGTADERGCAPWNAVDARRARASPPRARATSARDANRATSVKIEPHGALRLSLVEENTALKPDSAKSYALRLRRVLDYIDRHLEEDLSVERLSDVAAFSRFHFHRQFSLCFGLGVGAYVQLLRMKRASFQLAFRGSLRVVDVALGAGYESHEAFSRAFKRSIGQTPSEFRARPDWAPWHEAHRRLEEIRAMQKTEHQKSDVKIVDFPTTRVAALEHRGDPKLLMETVRKFIAWRKENRLPPKVAATFNILWDDPDATPPEEFRFDVAAATEKRIDENAYGVVAKTIPGGRCAVLRHVGSDDRLGDAVRYLYAEWLPASGEEARDFPLYARRVVFFPDVPEHEAVTDVFLPLR